MRSAVLALLLGLALGAPPVAAAVPDETTALAASRAAIGRRVDGLRFVESSGATLTLDRYRGRPLLVNLVYTACSDVCPTVVQNLYPAVEIAREALGAEAFSVITVGFDPRHDTPERMRSFARQQGVDFSNWHFLSGDRATIDALAEAVGFTFYPSAAGFDHLAQVSVIDADGRVYQQVYGGIFEPPAIVEPLKDLVFGRGRSIWSSKGLLDRVKLFCTIYDPRTGRYYFSYSLFIGIAVGGTGLAGFGIFLLREWCRSVARGL
jgi:protein SCO1/2